MRPTGTAAVPFAGTHDHAECIERALRRAAELCGRRGARLTPLRRRVLELVWRGHAPVGAYAVLEGLRAEGRAAAPPSVYRALGFLVRHGLVHRVESLNAFVGCAHPGPEHAGQFLICENCGTAAEIADPRIRKALARRARRLGFAVGRQTVEVLGACASCQTRSRRKGGGSHARR